MYTLLTIIACVAIAYVVYKAIKGKADIEALEQSIEQGSSALCTGQTTECCNEPTKCMEPTAPLQASGTIKAEVEVLGITPKADVEPAVAPAKKPRKPRAKKVTKEA